jgi:hypothetical protein
MIDPGAQPLSRQKRDSLMNESASGTSASGVRRKIVRRTSKGAKDGKEVKDSREAKDAGSVSSATGDE